MEFNAQIRKQIKAEQKERVLSNKGRFLLVLVLCALPGMLLQTLATEIGGDVNVILEYAMTPNASQMVMQTLLLNYVKWSVIFSIISIVVLAPITFGEMSFMINASRGNMEGATSIFKPFSSGKEIWRCIRMQFCLMFRAFVWMILPIAIFTAAFTVILIGGMNMGGGLSESAIVPIVLLFVVYMIAIIFISVKVEMYTGGYVFMRDDEDIGVWDATRRAANVFKGHYMDLLKFEFSFMLWILGPTAFLMFAALITITSPGLGLLLLIIGLIAMLVIVLFLSVYRSTSYFAMFDYLANDGVRVFDNGGGSTLADELKE